MRAVIAALLAVFLLPAQAHEDARWIQERSIKNAVGELCCGERDCVPIEENDVRVTQSGYLIKSTRELVPFNEALPLPADERALGRYWICHWGGQRKCFFAPASGS